MKFGKRLAVLSMSVMTTAGMTAKAQFMPSMAGTGYNMGQQACPTQMRAGNGAESYLEEYNDIKKSMSEEKRRLSDMERKQRALDKEIEKAKRIIESNVNDTYSGFILAHMDSRALCTDYKGIGTPPPVIPAPPEGDNSEAPPRADPTKGGKRESSSNEINTSRMPASVTTREGGRDVAGGGREGSTEITGFTRQQWAEVCVPNKRGMVSAAVCVRSPYKADARSRYSDNECKKALNDYSSKIGESQKLAEQIEASKDLIARYKEDLPAAMKDAKERYKEDTESGICMDCMARGNGYITQKQGPDWAGVTANVGVGLLAMYAGYKTNKMVAEYNSDLGWPTQAYPAWGYGLPFLANGIYGALGGGTGQGTFACAGQGGQGNGLYGNMGMQGPYGYPNGMFGGQMGGGMYNGGMGPFGVAGPWGLGGGGQMGMPGYPMMGGMSPYGAMGGMSPYGAFVSGGLGAMSPYGAMGGMSPYGGMGGMSPFGGMGGMSPYGAFVSGGIGAFMGGMSPYGGMGGMSPYGGMSPFGAMGGMSPYGAFMGGGMSPYGAMGGMSPYGGMGAMGGGMDMQYQQAMMQMQMQQQQMYMQQQQQQAQNYMARQQTYMGLAQQMSELQAKMQMVMMGGSLGTSIYGGSSVIPSTGIYNGGSYGNYGTGNPSVPIPAPGAGGSTLPGGGVGGGTIIPAGTR